MGTPKKLLRSVERFLDISNFYIDLAADGKNAVVPYHLHKDNLGGSFDYSWGEILPAHQWGWLNPEYSDIAPWVKKASEFVEESRMKAGVAVLIPSSTGANWWADYVNAKAYVLFLKGRVTFVGHKTPYPKDVALLLYSDQYEPGYDVWDWKHQPSQE